MAEPLQPERRSRLRITQSFHATYRQVGGPSPSWCSMSAVNLGLTGARFRSPRSLEQDCVLELSILLPKTVHPFLLRARVIWSKTYPSGILEYGVEFIDVTPDQARQIGKLVESLLKGRPTT